MGNVKETKKEKIKHKFIDLGFVIVGCLIAAFSSIGVLIPNGLSSGGLTGMVRILETFVDIEFSLLYYAGSIIILLVCGVLLGIREAKKIALVTIVYPPCLMLLEYFSPYLLAEKDMTLAAIYYGVLSGIGCGLVFVRGYSFGGTDTIAKIIKVKIFPHVAMSQILLFIDATVVIASGFVYGKNVALYALISSVIFTKACDMILYGFDPKVVQLEIITDKHAEVADYIINDIVRGITNVDITGEYTKATKQKMVTICSPRESMLIKQFVARIDENAFVTVLRVETVWGRGKGFNDLDGK